MATAIIIPSFGRKGMLEATLDGLFPQLDSGDRIVVVTHREEDAPSFQRPGLSAIPGRKGSACQRNSGLDFLRASGQAFSLVLFIDDDVVLAPEFLSNLKRYHAAYPEAAGFGCHVIADGARSGEITRAAADEMARNWQRPSAACGLILTTAPYVAFSMRGDLIGQCRFDERLAEYGFMEDWDFFARLRSLGPTGYAADCGLVHLAASGGRTSQRKFGFSQITNPLYLAKKGVLPRSNCTRHISKAFAANLLGIHSRHRRERLRGNLLAVWYFLRHGPSPELVARIYDGP